MATPKGATSQMCAVVSRSAANTLRSPPPSADAGSPPSTAACATSEADGAILDAATALAWTIIDVAHETIRRALIDRALTLPAVSTRARQAAKEFV
jgi:hypothetical protein